ncbi:MAG: calcium-binding protein [Chloroflexi bacterium]|nr:calcium-binding protein [Chloroflexota bacterium]
MKITIGHCVQRWLSAIALVGLQLAAAQPIPASASCSPSPTSGDDTIACDGANDTVDALAGNDSVSGGDGNDSLTGGDGDDQLYGDSGLDILRGDAGNDQIYDSDSVQLVRGGIGNDTITLVITSGSGSNSWIQANAGNDTLTINFVGNPGLVNKGIAGDSNTTRTQAAYDSYDPTDGNDTITVSGSWSGGYVVLNSGDDSYINNSSTSAFPGADGVHGGMGNDTLIGGSVGESLDGDMGNDTLQGRGGNNTLYGGPGDDTADYSSSPGPVNANLATGQATADGYGTSDTLIEFENLTGGASDDVLTGDAGPNVLTGGAGNDLLDGGLGTDTVAQTVDADQTLTDTQLTGNGIDTLAGIESARLAGGASANTLDASAFSGTTTLDGLAGDDVLRGGAGNDTLTGGAGNDTLYTSAGVDSLDGGDDNDTLVILGTNVVGDTVSGGSGVNLFRFMPGTTGALEAVSAGDDTLDFGVFSLPITLDLSNPAQQNVGGGLLLTLTGFFKNVIGTLFDDVITGNSTTNSLSGLGGNDYLAGASGDDSLIGGDGDDTLDGGAGTDNLDGSAGTDTVANYESQDTHTSIELGLPAPPTPPVPTPVPAQPSDTAATPTIDWTAILDDGGGTWSLSCRSPLTRLLLHTGDYVDFTGLCGYKGRLQEQSENALPAPLATPAAYASALEANLFHQGAAIDILPDGTTLTVSFVAPLSIERKTVSILFWDATLKDGLGDWVALPQMDAQGPSFEATPLYPELPEDGRWISRGVRVTAAGRVEATVNFTGVFVLIVDP